MDPDVRHRVLTRCLSRCECGCGAKLPPGELDHFFGRREEETEANCWFLSVRCHYAKTNNSPNASTWLRKFAEHCDRHGYTESATRARARLDFVDTRRMLGSALGARR